MNHKRAIVNFSGGGASYLSAQFAVEEFGPENVVLLFADTLIEDEDLYRFNRDAEIKLGVTITRICEGRTPWEVFFAERMMGNTRADHCSRILKREQLDKWRSKNSNPETDVVICGFDAVEEHRLRGVQRQLAPWTVRSPLVERSIFKETGLQMIEAAGLRLPRLYAWGFPHNNCGGFCIKAGQGSFKLLYEHLPDRYLEHEGKEEAFRRFTGKDVSILRDRRGGTAKPLTLRELRRRIETDPKTVDKFDLGGCDCMTPPEEEFTLEEMLK